MNSILRRSLGRKKGLPFLAAARSLSCERLKARLGIILGVVGTVDKAASETDQSKEARQLAQEALQLVLESPKRCLTDQEAISASAKVGASEALVLDRLPIDYLASALRDNCMEILVLTEGINGDFVAQERRFITDTLKDLNSSTDLTQERLRRLYLDARQRLDTIVASKTVLIEAAHYFMSKLWRRTGLAVFICSVPVMLFLYERYWRSTDSKEALPQTTSSFDVNAAETAKLFIPILQADLKKLPPISKKPKLDLNDLRGLFDTPSYFDSGSGFEKLLEITAVIAKEVDAPPEIVPLGKRIR